MAQVRREAPASGRDPVGSLIAGQEVFPAAAPGGISDGLQPHQEVSVSTTACNNLRGQAMLHTVFSPVFLP